MLQINPPGQQTPEAFLERYSKPSLLPDWPASPNVAVCAVWQTGHEVTEGWVMVSQVELDEVMAREDPVLYYTVPKDVLLRPDVVPGLSPDSFN